MVANDAVREGVRKTAMDVMLAIYDTVLTHQPGMAPVALSGMIDGLIDATVAVDLDANRMQVLHIIEGVFAMRLNKAREK